MNETLTRREYEALRTILQEIRKGSPPPTRAQIGRAMGSDGGKIASFLEGLERKGWASPAYDAGPWLPLRDLDGTQLRVRFVVEREEVTP
jgi:hypothetical protein